MAAPQGADASIHPELQQATGGAPVEMEALPSTATHTQEPHPVDQVDPTSSMAQPTDDSARIAPASTTVVSEAHATISQSATVPAETPAPLTRKQTEALGPATDADLAALAQTSTNAGPALNINLMLTTGAKHPYKIDEKYLTNRNTVAKSPSGDGSFDPMAITGYKLKELIWTDWRKEWEPRPASPSAIRLITMGKMVDDKKTLNDYSFGIDKVNVVHMTVKPADFGDDEETAAKHGGKGGSIRTRDGGEGGAGCRCVIL
ncbi:hypothetical protein LTR17_008183 [Elasticomyces elasticus]|nr:hypothetical protein LTR17_008183 [Elasticomyces elasticus]